MDNCFPVCRPGIFTALSSFEGRWRQIIGASPDAFTLCVGGAVVHGSVPIAAIELKKQGRVVGSPYQSSLGPLVMRHFTTIIPRDEYL